MVLMEVESIKSTNFKFVRFANLRTEPYKAMFYYGYVPRPKNIKFWLFRIVRTSFCLVWYFSPLYQTALLFNRPVSYFNVFARPCQFWTLATLSDKGPKQNIEPTNTNHNDRMMCYENEAWWPRWAEMDSNHRLH